MAEIAHRYILQRYKRKKETDNQLETIFMLFQKITEKDSSQLQSTLLQKEKER